jgi:hypothetical protein
MPSFVCGILEQNLIPLVFRYIYEASGRSQWTCGLRHEMSLLVKFLDRGFQSHSRNVSLSVVYSVFVLSCIGIGLSTGLIPRPKNPTDVYKIRSFRSNSEREKTRETNQSR